MVKRRSLGHTTAMHVSISDPTPSRLPSRIVALASRALAVCLAFSAFSIHAQAPSAPIVQGEPSKPVAQRPKIALVLSGGGARGAAHVGVMKVLEELRVPVDIVVGTSMGALVGAAYASGTPAAELEDRLVKADWNDLFTDSSPREDRSFLRKEEDQARLLRLEFGVSRDGLKLPAGAISGQKLDGLFSRITRYAPGVVDFDQLPIRFRAVSTNAETGKMTVFARGRLPDVMRASMAVPGAVAPYPIGDNLYLDGGLTRNLPIDVARELGADIVIAVNIGSGLLKRDELQSIVGVSLQMINILTEQNVRASLESLKETDVLIAPKLDQIGSTDFERASEAIKIGVETARAMAPRLAALSVTPIVYAQYMDERHVRLGRPVTREDTIEQVRVTGLTRANEDELKRTLNVQPGEKVDFKKIDRGISRVFGTGYFERVNYSLLNEGDRQVLAVNATEKPWGPNYLRVGLSLAADTVGEGRFNLLIRSQQTQFNAAGAEWRNDLQVGRDNRFATRFFQPFGAGSFVNIAPGAEIARRPIDIFFEGKRLAQYDVTSSSFGIDLGMDLSRNAIARIGYVRGNDSARLSIGPDTLPDRRVRQAGFRFRTVYDSLDDPSFPRTGSLVSVDYLASLSALGATSNYRKVEVNFADHYSFGANTFALAGRYGSTSGDELPVFDQFSLGGFLQLSGYRPGELLGQRVAFGRLSYYRQLPPSLTLVGRRVFAGVSAEAGRISSAFQTLSPGDYKSSVGLFLGADTPLGPLYLGYGRTRERGTIFYFFLGQP
jgi:NTE family protein